MKTLTVLMSTYNGEKYLEKQLQSLYEQDAKANYRIYCLVRDDGSTDETLNILYRWKSSLKLDINEGKNVGARDSFFWLLRNAPESDYYAFCDQDDIWEKDKLSKAINEIEKGNDLYFSNLNYIDERDQRTGRVLLSDSFSLSLKRVLMCNPANGCTMVWRNRLQNLFKDIPSDTFTMHDEYVCTVAVLLGKIHYDSSSHMGYRIHTANVTQANSIYSKLKITRSIWFGRKRYSLDKRAATLVELKLRSEDRITLEQLKNYKRGMNRFRLIKKYQCEEFGIQRSFRLRMILGLL